MLVIKTITYITTRQIEIINTFKIDGIFFLYKAKWAQVHKDLFFYSFKKK